MAAQTPSIQLHDPAALAKALPDKTIRPWAYQTMGGFMGLSDPAWADIVQNVGLLIAMAAGLVLPRFQKWKVNWGWRMVLLTLFAVPLGMAASYIANNLILQSGPDAFIGGVALPIEFTVASLFSWHVAGWLDKLIFKRRTPSAP